MALLPVAIGAGVNASAFAGRRLAERVVREAGLSPAMLPRGSAGAAEDVYVAAYVLAMRALLDRAAQASVAERHWILQVRVALRALLGELSVCPEVAVALRTS